MIDIKTLKLVRILDELALLTEEGIAPFAEADDDTLDIMAFFDDTKADANGLFPVVRDVDDEDPENFKVVSYYGEGQDDYQVRVVNDDDMPYILVTFKDSDEQIAVEDGSWDFLI